MRALFETFELPVQTQLKILPKRYFTFVGNETIVNLY